MEVKKITRIVLLCCFFINITALFLTHHSMAMYPCNENVKICVIEMNPIADHIIKSGGFTASFVFAISFWIFIFIFYELFLIKKFHIEKPRFTVSLPFMLLFLLTIDLLNNILLYTSMPLLL